MGIALFFTIMITATFGILTWFSKYRSETYLKRTLDKIKVYPIHLMFGYLIVLLS